MNQKDLCSLQEIVEERLDKARKSALDARWAAKRMRGASRSQQGDRKMFENAADLAEGNLAELEELDLAIHQYKIETKQTVQSICTVVLEFNQGKRTKFFFVPTRAGITDPQFLTPQSPLGQAIFNKKAGQRFTYQITQENKTRTFSGKIIEID